MVRRQLPPSGIRSIFDRAQALKAAGRKILHLDVGRPDWPLPPSAIDAAHRAMKDGYNHYLENRGLLSFRNLISDRIFTKTQRRFSPGTEILVSVGGTEALAIVAMALCDSQDEILVPTPAWNHYLALQELTGAKVIQIPTRLEDKFQLNSQEIERAISPRTKLLILNSPSNPTGVVQNSASLDAVARICERAGIYLLSDEVYDDFVFHGEHESVLRWLKDYPRAIYLNSFSKTYSMTGWRIGVLAAEASLMDAFNRVHQYLTVCASSPFQYALQGVLQHPETPSFLNAMREAFEKRAQIWNDGLAELPGVEFVRAEGAFYVFPRLQRKGVSAREFSSNLLEHHGISVVPGDVFGRGFENHFRISFGGDLETQRAALSQMKEVLCG